MLRLARLADYGLLIASSLGGPQDPLMKLEQIAEQTELSVATVRKVIKRLVDGDIVHSERGVKGGYRLAHPAPHISLATVLRAMEGDMALTDCCSDARPCDVVKTCTVQSNWSVINQTVGEIFERLTLHDMTRRLTKGDVISKVRLDEDVVPISLQL